MKNEILSYIADVMVQIELDERALARYYALGDKEGTLSPYELGVLKGALDGLIRCRLTLEEFGNKLHDGDPTTEE